MKYSDFETALSAERICRYVNACGGDTRKAMTLYRENLRLSQEMFTLVSCFEVTLRNAIDRRMVSAFGSDWLRDAISPNGMFTSPQIGQTCRIISRAYQKLQGNGTYTHSKLLAEMDFGVWKIYVLKSSIQGYGASVARHISQSSKVVGEYAI